MFCEKCGKPNDDDALFCENCGAPISCVQPAAPVTPPPAVPPVPPAEPKPKGPSLAERTKDFLSKHKMVLPAAGAVAAVIVVVLIIAAVLGRQVKMDAYLDLNVTGYNGYGVMNLDFDRTSFGMRSIGLKEYKDYGSFDPDDMTSQQLKALQKKYKKQLNKSSDLVDSIYVDVEYPDGKSSRNLSNGDVVKLNVQFNEAAAKELHLSLKKTQIEYTVKDLPDAAAFDVMQYFGVEFDGYSGTGTGNVVCTKAFSVHVGDMTVHTELGQNYFTCSSDRRSYDVYIRSQERMEYLSNGDTVHLYARDVEEDSFASSGMLLTNMEKDVTVSGLKDMTTVDLMEYYTVQFLGLNGRGEASVESTTDTVTVGEITFNFQENRCYANDSYVSGLYTNLSRSWSLENGQELVLTIQVDEDALARYGVALEQRERVITVSNLADYAESLEQISGSLDELIAGGKAIVNDYLNSSWSSAVHDSWSKYTDQYMADDLQHYATILTTAKSTSTNTRNTLWLIYSVTVRDSKFKENTVIYLAVSENNIAVYSDGMIMETNTSKSKYAGSTSFADLFKNRINSYNLNIFSSVDVSEYIAK